MKLRSILGYEDSVQVKPVKEDPGVLAITGKMADNTRMTVFVKTENPTVLASLKEMLMVFGCKCYEEASKDV